MRVILTIVIDELTLRVEKLEGCVGMSGREAREYLVDAKEIRREDAEK